MFLNVFVVRPHPKYLFYIYASLVHLRIFSISRRLFTTIANSYKSCFAVGPARAYSRGKEEKKTKRRNHAESSGSCTYAGSAPDRCRGSLLLSRRQVLLLDLSPDPSLTPSSLPHAGFLRSEACVRVSPSFPFIAAHSSASPSRVLGVTAFSPASRDHDPKSIHSFFPRRRNTEKNVLLACQQEVRTKRILILPIIRILIIVIQ